MRGERYRSSMGTCVLVVLLLAIPVHAQDVVLGDPISLHGVEVRGLRSRRADDERLPRIQTRGPVRIVLMSGGRAHGGATVQVCGHDATRDERRYPGTASARVDIPGTHDPSAHLISPERPPMTYVRVVLEHVVEGEPHRVTIEWSVPTAQRERFRALEDAFFASIRCSG
jgi:hypothetical protein